MARSSAGGGDLTNIKNSLQGQINGLHAEAGMADLSDQAGTPIAAQHAANLRRIAREWQKVVDGTT